MPEQENFLSRQRYFVRSAYRGTRYRGWQRQAGGVITVQQTIEEVLARVMHEPVRVVGCGRTDAGVHASEYFLHFDCEGKLREDWLFIVNKQLPEDIVFYEVWPVAGSAHTRYDATQRTYDYFLHTAADPFLAPMSGYYPFDKINLGLLGAALAGLEGQHDFRAFCLTPDRHNTTACDLREASFHRVADGRYRFRFVADRFLRGMIRILVHQLLLVGKGELAVEKFLGALRTGERLTATQAWPEGLFLSRVEYDSLEL